MRGGEGWVKNEEEEESCPPCVFWYCSGEGSFAKVYIGVHLFTGKQTMPLIALTVP